MSERKKLKRKDFDIKLRLDLFFKYLHRMIRKMLYKDVIASNESYLMLLRRR
jgi:hypothetical protein